MSAINVFVREDSVHLVTDGAGYADGKLNAVVQKACILPHLNCAFAARGPIEILQELNIVLSGYQSVETMKRALAEDLPLVFSDRIDADPDHWHFDLVVAGMKASGPFAWLISSLPRPEHRAFELMPIPFAWGSPPVSAAMQGTIGNLITDDPRAAAKAMLEAQRLSTDTTVGAYGQMVTIVDEGAYVELICRWPDVLGKPINRKARAA